MTFEEIWIRVGKLNVLPDTAIQQVPSVLASPTKKMLSKKTPEEILKIVLEAINDVNDGSVETLDALVMKRLKRP